MSRRVSSPPFLLILGLLFGLILLPACPGGEDPTPENRRDAEAGVNPSVTAAPGEVRAGRIEPGEEGAVFGGIGAEGKTGDFKIYNDRVQFIVQGAYYSHGYVDTGGMLIDVDLVRGPTTLHRDPFDDFFLSHGVGWLFHASKVEVIEDGGSGTATVRSTGHFEPWKFIHGAIEADEPILTEAPVEITVDFRLAANANTLEIEATFTNNSGEIARLNPSFGFLGSDEELMSWAAARGLSPLGLDSSGAIGVVDRSGGATYSIWKPEGNLEVISLQDLISQAGISGTADGWTDIFPGESASLRRNITVAQSTLQAEAIRREAQGETLVPIAGQVTANGNPDAKAGDPVAGARVHIVGSEVPGEETTAPEILGFAVTNEEGKWSGHVPPGDWRVVVTGRGGAEYVDVPAASGRYAPYGLEAVNQRQIAVIAGAAEATAIPFARGYVSPEPMPVTVSSEGSQGVDVELQRNGSILISAKDTQGTPLPFYAEVKATSGSILNEGALGGSRRGLGLREEGNIFAKLWSGDGNMELPVPTGSYEIHISHSWRHERADITDVTVGAGETVEVLASLATAVARDGWLALDSHLHAAPSNDGSLAMEDRLLTCAAAGVDLPVTTDHDRMADYRPLAAAMGLAQRMNVLPGIEVSSVLRGHINLFPVEPDSSLLNGGSPDWPALRGNTQDYIDIIRDAGTEHSLVHINHGRSGMFDFGSYNPSSGTYVDDSFSWDFDLFELSNGARVSSREELKRDYFSFLSVGELKVPTGVSDSHSRTTPCGLAHTDVFLDSDDPGAVTPEALREAMMKGHVVVSTGPQLRASVGEALPGDTVEGSQHSFSVRVGGPSYIVPDEVRLIRNGEVVDVRPVESSTPANGVWLETTFEIDETEDAWYVVETEGGSEMGHIWRGGTPYAITGAFLVDVEGNGWQAPGL